jgi:phosphatidylglycerol---prolipoprotein diacylglyceryl transferase
MYRELFQVFGVTLYSYGLMLVVGFVVAIWFARKRASRFGLEPDKISDAAFVAIIAGVLGARIGFIIQYLPDFLSDYHKLFAWRFEGLTSFGGLVGGALAVLVWTRFAKVRTVNLCDAIAPSFLIGHAIGRIGCLLNGCCYGGKCDLPWGIRVLADKNHFLPGHYHPAQIYDMFLNFAALAIVLYMERSRWRPGFTTAWVLILHGLARFIYEFWRAGTTSGYVGRLPITEAQLAAIGVTVVGVVVWFFARKSPVPETA